MNFDFTVLNITINNNNKSINENYKINNLIVYNLKNKKEFDKHERYEENENKTRYLEDDINYILINKIILKYLIDVTDSKNIKRAVNFLDYSHEELTLLNKYINQLCDGKFIYNKLNKTLYCVNNGPGVNEIAKIYNFFMNEYEYDPIANKNSKKIINEQQSEDLIENLLNIKRIGDYSQIDYCKKNNYIYVSNDIMSSSFSYIVGSKYIGSLSNFGIFLKPNNEYESCISQKNKL
jgi:hypothetical protein